MFCHGFRWSLVWMCVLLYCYKKEAIFGNEFSTYNIFPSHRQNRWNQNTRENNLGENLPIAIPVDDSITYAVVTVSIYMM